MDLCADQLLAQLPTTSLAVSDLAAPFRRRAQRLPVVGAKNAAFNADRLFNRHFTLLQFLRARAREFDFFHIVDHSYAHAVLALPPGRAGVYCHDLDAFRSLLEPAQERRPWWFRKLARRTLRGLQAAAVVFHNSREVGRQLVDVGLVPAEKLIHAPLGVSSEFTPNGVPVELPSPGPPPRFLLHVGSHIPRKRIDVLLDVFAAVLKVVPDLRLVQVGPTWAPTFARQIERLGLESQIVRFLDLSRQQLAELYRRAEVVLVPSEAEGFGLPVIEALACGATVIASDIPVLREVGGDVVRFCAVGDIPAWANSVTMAIGHPTRMPTLHERLQRASLYSWKRHAEIIAEAYQRLPR